MHDVMSVSRRRRNGKLNGTPRCRYLTSKWDETVRQSTTCVYCAGQCNRASLTAVRIIIRMTGVVSRVAAERYILYRLPAFSCTLQAYTVSVGGRAAAMICPRLGLQVVTRYTIYVMYAYGKVAITVCPCWPASTTNKSRLVTLTFHLLILKVVSKSRVTWWATSVPILVFLGLSVLDLGPMYATDRQTDRRQTSNSISA